ncbi:MAG: ribosome maturation factor RimM [Hyphomicrobiales bacterium]|nr:ribosome maturation factor RimM [Hyphomicrobiales bacterium]
MGTARDFVLVGVIVGAHGIKGEVKLKSFTSDPLSIGRYGPLQSISGRKFEIARLKAAKDDFIASLKNVNDRNEAETLKGVELFVAREKLPKLKTHEAYAHDLMGLDVVLENGSTLGKLVAMPNYGAGDLLEVAVDGKAETVLIPFTNAFVPQEDFSTGRITVILPEGYLDDDDD